MVYQEISDCRFCREEFVYDVNVGNFVRQYNHESNLSNILCNCNNPNIGYFEDDENLDSDIAFYDGETVYFENDNGIYLYNDNVEREYIIPLLEEDDGYNYENNIDYDSDDDYDDYASDNSDDSDEYVTACSCVCEDD